MTVIANDFVPIQPYDTDVVTLGVSPPFVFYLTYLILAITTGRRPTHVHLSESTLACQIFRLDALIN